MRRKIKEFCEKYACTLGRFIQKIMLFICFCVPISVFVTIASGKFFAMYILAILAVVFSCISCVWLAMEIYQEIYVEG